VLRCGQRGCLRPKSAFLLRHRRIVNIFLYGRFVINRIDLNILPSCSTACRWQYRMAALRWRHRWGTSSCWSSLVRAPCLRHPVVHWKRPPLHLLTLC
jgi:hypothetical protein